MECSLILLIHGQPSNIYVAHVPFVVLQLTTPNQPSFSCPSRVSTMKPHSITAQNIRLSSGPNHFDSRNFWTATELPNCLTADAEWLLLLFVWLLLLLVKSGAVDDDHHLIWPITLLARERGFWSIGTQAHNRIGNEKFGLKFVCFLMWGDKSNSWISVTVTLIFQLML